MTAPVGTRPKAKKPKKERVALEIVPEDGHPGNSKFARALGSVDYQTREKGLAALTRWLVRKTELKESDMMKIWKGLFYCFWHSDKAPVQAELAERLAAMLTQLSEQSAYMFFAAFMTTMRREWFGIDRLRLDKFLMLIRKFVNRMLACLQAANWRLDLVQRYSDYLREHVVTPRDTLTAAGVAYHFGDLLLEELRAVAGDRPVPGATLATLLAPFCNALQSGEQVVLHRIGEGVFDTLLSELANPSDDSPYLQQLDVAALSAQLFELGAAPTTRARNRQVLYDLSNTLERLQRKRQRVDTGAQAGPSSDAAKPAGKSSKKQQKQRAAPEAETAAPAAPVQAEPEASVPAAAPKRQKRKAPNGDMAEPEGARQGGDSAVGNGQQEEQPGQKLGKKQKKKLQAEPLGGAVEAQATVVPAAAATGEKAADGVGAGAVAKASAKEPTSGQKAALRSAVAKVGQTPVAKAAKVKGGSEGAAKQQAEGDGEAAAPTPTPASTPAAAKASALGKRRSPGSGGKESPAERAKAKQQANGGNKTPAPAAGAAAANGHAPTTAKKGRVVINLKKNLYFEHGGPVPDPDIRTPPPARSKGGILKKSAKSCPPKMAPSAAAAQRPRQANGAQSARVVPKKARRASAALFF